MAKTLWWNHREVCQPGRKKPLRFSPTQSEFALKKSLNRSKKQRIPLIPLKEKPKRPARRKWSKKTPLRESRRGRRTKRSTPFLLQCQMRRKREAKKLRKKSSRNRLKRVRAAESEVLETRRIPFRRRRSEVARRRKEKKLPKRILFQR